MGKSGTRKKMEKKKQRQPVIGDRFICGPRISIIDSGEAEEVGFLLVGKLRSAETLMIFYVTQR